MSTSTVLLTGMTGLDSNTALEVDTTRASAPWPRIGNVAIGVWIIAHGLMTPVLGDGLGGRIHDSKADTRVGETV